MTTEILKDQKIWFDAYDLTGYSNRVSMQYEADSLEDTVFGDDTHSYKGGLKMVSAGIGGLFDDVPDEALQSNIGAAGKILTFGRNGTAGNAVWSFQSMAGQYQFGGNVGELCKFSLGAAAGGKLVRGTLMENRLAAAATADGAGRQLGAALSTQRVYAGLHVLAAGGTDPTLDVVVESDDNSGFTSATTRISFTQFTAAGAEWKELAGAVADDYWRLSWTIGGTDPEFDFIGFIAIL